MSDLKRALRHQGYDKHEIAEALGEMVARVEDGEDPEDVLFDYGLEPDYVFDILDLV